MPEAQEAAIKDDNIMVDLDTTGKSVDVELDDSKANTKEVETKDQPIVEVKEEKKDEREEYSDGVKKRIDTVTILFAFIFYLFCKTKSFFFSSLCFTNFIC